MTPATLFDIAITDRASRLVAADVAEERNLEELATALRNTNRAVVLETTEPPVLLPDATSWSWHTTPALPARTARGLLLHLLKVVGYGLVELCIVHDRIGRCPGGAAWQRFQLDLAERGEGFEDADPESEDFLVRPGIVLVLFPVVTPEPEQPHQRLGPAALLHFHPADAPRFGFGYVPAFPEE